MGREGGGDAMDLVDPGLRGWRASESRIRGDPWILKDPRLPESEEIPGGEGPFDVVSTFLVFVFLHGNRIIMLFYCCRIYIYFFFSLDDVLFVI